MSNVPNYLATAPTVLTYMGGNIKKLHVDRFWKKVSVSETGCWLWTASKNNKGYGELRVTNIHTLAHRFAYCIYYQQDPCNLDVLHSCDTPACVNPLHLRLGTHKENMQDMADKGRCKAVSGEKHYFAKLTKEKVLSIRKSPLPGVRLATLYNVHPCTITDIRVGRTWRHLL